VCGHSRSVKIGGSTHILPYHASHGQSVFAAAVPTSWGGMTEMLSDNLVGPPFDEVLPPTLVQGHNPTRVCLCNSQYFFYHETICALLSLSTTKMTLFTRGFTNWIGGHQQIYSACMCVRGESHTQSLRSRRGDGAVHSASCIYPMLTNTKFQLAGDGD